MLHRHAQGGGDTADSASKTCSGCRRRSQRLGAPTPRMHSRDDTGEIALVAATASVRRTCCCPGVAVHVWARLRRPTRRGGSRSRARVKCPQAHRRFRHSGRPRCAERAARPVLPRRISRERRRPTNMTPLYVNPYDKNPPHMSVPCPSHDSQTASSPPWSWLCSWSFGSQTCGGGRRRADLRRRERMSSSSSAGTQTQRPSAWPWPPVVEAHLVRRDEPGSISSARYICHHLAGRLLVGACLYSTSPPRAKRSASTFACRLSGVARQSLNDAASAAPSRF